MQSNNKFESNKKYFTISIYTLMVVLGSALIIKCVFSWGVVSAGLNSIIHSLMPFIIGFFVAYLLSPVVRVLDRKFFRGFLRFKSKKVSGAFAIIFTYIFVIIALVLLVRIIVPQTYDSLYDLVVNKLPLWVTQITALLEDLAVKYPHIFTEELQSNLAGSISKYLNTDKITETLTTLVPQVLSTSISIINGIFNLLIAIIVSVYMLMDRRIISSGMKRLLYALLPDKTAASIIRNADESNAIFGRFIWGKTLDSVIIGILCMLGMTVLKLPYAPLISLIVGITNMIPYFGPFIGAVPGALIILMTSPVKTLIYLIMILVLQQFDGLYLGPKILGDSTGLRPVWIIFAITVGGSFAGPIGMFLGVPVVAVIQHLLAKWVGYRLEEKKHLDKTVLQSRPTHEIPIIPKKPSKPKQS